MSSARPALGLRLARRAALCMLLVAVTACACPPLVECWDTPQDTLELWQAHLCRDEVTGEYACLSLDFQSRMNGFQNYYIARSALLEREPAAAWLFAHADLREHVVESRLEPDGQHATLVLQAGDQPFTISFAREAWAAATWDDGSTQLARQRAPLEALVLRGADGRQSLSLARPELRDAAHLREVKLSSRWLISDIEGLAAGPAP